MGILQTVAVFTLQFGLFAHSLQAAAFVFGFHLQVFSGTRTVGQFVFEFLAGNHAAVVVQRKLIAGGNRFGLLVVIHPLGVEHLLVALDNHIAFGAYFYIGLAGDIIGGNPGVIGRQRRFAAGFHFWRRGCRRSDFRRVAA